MLWRDHAYAQARLSLRCLYMICIYIVRNKFSWTSSNMEIVTIVTCASDFGTYRIFDRLLCACVVPQEPSLPVHAHIQYGYMLLPKSRFLNPLDSRVKTWPSCMPSVSCIDPWQCSGFYPGSGVVLDCIDYWSLPSFLLYCISTVSLKNISLLKMLSLSGTSK